MEYKMDQSLININIEYFQTLAGNDYINYFIDKLRKMIF